MNRAKLLISHRKLSKNNVVNKGIWFEWPENCFIKMKKQVLDAYYLQLLDNW